MARDKNRIKIDYSTTRGLNLVGLDRGLQFSILRTCVIQTRFLFSSVLRRTESTLNLYHKVRKPVSICNEYTFIKLESRLDIENKVMTNIHVKDSQVNSILRIK